tara:strand:+ start:51 stop:470 length:420 start_codon:yes stop_codon:yes gene_type:complete
MNILFLCVANSARSQIAEGLAKAMLDNKHNIQSAGSKPSGIVHPAAKETLSDMGINITSHKSKAIEDLEEDFLKDLDYVVTLCNEEICPIIKTKAVSLRWLNEDPANNIFNDAQIKIAFKKTRNNIYQLLKKFMMDNAL